jgi:hypothetical protein
VVPDFANRIDAELELTLNGRNAPFAWKIIKKMMQTYKNLLINICKKDATNLSTKNYSLSGL